MSKLFQDYFDYLEDFGHKDLFQNSVALWEPLNRLGNYLTQFLIQLPSYNSWEEPKIGFRKNYFKRLCKSGYCN